MSIKLFHSQNKSYGGVTSPAGNDPTDLTWNKIHEERYFTPIDYNFLKYESDFSVDISGLSVVSGPTPTVSSNRLNITNSCKWKTPNSCDTGWIACEMTINSMTSAGSQQRLGCGIYTNTAGYYYCSYDKSAGKVEIIRNLGTESVVATATITLNTTNLKIWFVLQGYNVNMWAQESGGALSLMLTYQEPTGTFLATGVPAIFHFSIFSTQSEAANHYVDSLKAGISGGFGIFNNRIVAHEDGSPYLYGGKLLMTGDIAAVSESSTAYTYLNAALFAVDLTDWSVETVGRYFFKRGINTYGGSNNHLYYVDSENYWVMTYSKVEVSAVLEENDNYLILSDADVFGETIFTEAQTNDVGFTVANQYDCNPRRIGGTWYVPCCSGFGAGRARLWTGPAIDNLTANEIYDDGIFLECAVWARLNNLWFILYCTFGDIKMRSFSYDTFDTQGLLDLPFSVSSVRIPAYDWFVKQSGGVSEYYLIGFDTNEAILTNAAGVTQTYPWSVGRLVVWKANETSVGYEFN